MFAPTLSRCTVPQITLSTKRLFIVVALAVWLGVVLEAVTLATLCLAGRTLAPDAVVANLVGKISWSVVVCTGLAFVTNGQPIGNLATGVVGLLAGVAGFVFARTMHHGVLAAMAIAPTVSFASPLGLATIKALEFGVLAVWLAHLCSNRRRSWKPFAFAGLVVGVAFGKIAIVVMAKAAMAAGQSLDAGDYVVRAVNEVLLPIGVSLVMYATGRLSACAQGEYIR